jgi:hypothetical protein
MRIFIFLIILISSLSAKNKIALLIGNQNYKNYPKLTTPINDIRAMKKLLEKKGFQSIILENATQIEIRQKLNNFRKIASKADISLFYYSGHAIAIEGKNYLLPTYTPMLKSKLNRYELISLNEIMNIASDAKSSIILIDARENITLPEKFQKGLAKIKPEKNSVVILSTSANKIASDNSHKSVFAKALLKNFQKDIDIEHILKNVQKDIFQQTDNHECFIYTGTILFENIYLNKNTILEVINIENSHIIMESSISCSGVGASIKIKKHRYIIRKEIDELAKLKNMRTYVLFSDNLSHSLYKNTQKYKRYEKVLSLIQEVQKSTLEEISLDENIGEINQFILFGKDKFNYDNKLTIDDYNYKLSNKVREILQKKLKEFSFKGEGPFLVTTIDNPIKDDNISCLCIDLAEFNNSAINEIINSYKQRLIDKGNSKFTFLEKLRNKLLSLITNANNNIRITKTAVAGDNF